MRCKESIPSNLSSKTLQRLAQHKMPWGAFTEHGETLPFLEGPRRSELILPSWDRLRRC